MRKTLRALLAAVAVLALLFAGAGAASASTPLKSDCSGTTVAGVCLPVTTTTTAAPLPPVNICTPVSSPHTRCGSVVTDHHCARWEHWNGNHCVSDSASGRIYNTCGDYYSHGLRSIRRGDTRFNDHLDFGHRGVICDQPTSSSTVLVSGDCTTVTTYYNDYRSSTSRWNDLASRYRGGHLSNAQRHELDAAARDRLRWRDAFDRSRPTVRTTCGCPTSVSDFPVTTAPASYTPPTTSSQVATTPSGGAETGDGL